MRTLFRFSVIAIAIAFFWPTATISAQPAATLWDAAIGGNNHRYEAVYVEAGLSWTAARDAAILRGGYLASVTSAEENIFIYGLVLDSKFWPQDAQGFFQGPWLGGFQSTATGEPTGGWEWVNGDPWTYTNWALSGPINPQPDNWLGIENYLGMLSYGPLAPFWNDYQVDPRENAMLGPVTGFIVEYDTPTAVPEPSASALIVSGLILLLGFGFVQSKSRI
jgi:hypothetical protein